MNFHSQALREEGVDEEAINSVKEFDYEKAGLTKKEIAIVEFCLKANADANSITDEEFNELKQLEVTDQEIVEALECMNTFTGFNKFCDALGITNDAWL